MPHVIDRAWQPSLAESSNVVESIAGVLYRQYGPRSRQKRQSNTAADEDPDNPEGTRTRVAPIDGGVVPVEGVVGGGVATGKRGGDVLREASMESASHPHPKLRP